MVRIHQGASVIAVALGNNWEPFLFCVLKSVLKPEAKQRLVITSLATLGTVLLFGLVSYALPFLLHQPFKRIKELWVLALYQWLITRQAPVQLSLLEITPNFR